MMIEDRVEFKEMFRVIVENFESVSKYIDYIRYFVNICKYSMTPQVTCVGCKPLLNQSSTKIMLGE